MAEEDDTSTLERARLCTVCRDAGVRSILRPFLINLTEAVLMCPNKKCTYPLGSQHPAEVISQHLSGSHLTQKRKAAEIICKRKRVCSEKANVPSNTHTSRKNSLSDELTEIDFIENKEIKHNHQNKHPPIKLVVTANGPNKSVCKRQLCSKYPLQYLHWWNRDAFCWLDVAMCVLAHSVAVRKLLLNVKSDKNLTSSIVKAFDKAQVAFQGDNPGKTVHLETSVGRVTVRTGGGDSPIRPAKLAKLVPETDVLETDQQNRMMEACTLLDTVREEVWQRLHPKLKCSRGSNDSPVFALPLILRESSPLMEKFLVHYRWEMTCTECGYQHTDSVARCLPTFPNVAPNFQMTEGTFLRDCFMCPASQQRMRMKFTKMPEVLLVHFVEGLDQSCYTKYDFQHNGCQYRVSAIIQYRNNPDHFVAWIRNIHDKAV